MNNSKTFLVMILFLLLFPSISKTQEFKTVSEAVTALENPDQKIRWAAIEYLSTNSNEATPILKNIVKNKGKGWIDAGTALTMTKDGTVAPFYIELLKDNFFEKDEKGNRVEYGLGSKHGCIVLPNIYGGFIAEQLGELKDNRAIPVLKEAIIKGDNHVRQKAYGSLYKVGGISLNELIEEAKTKPSVADSILEEIEKIGWENIHSDTEFAIQIFDMIINNFPNKDYKAASSHFWKIQCFELLGRYESALKECEEVLKYPEFDNLVVQAERNKEKLLQKINLRNEGVK